jgi:hypothetical protein
MDQIPVVLDEQATLPPINIDNSMPLIAATIAQAAVAQKASIERAKTKAASERLLLNTISELLQTPQGMSTADLLVASESELVGPLVLKIRNYLKRDNIYTLEKHGNGRKAIYVIKKASDNTP